MRGQAKSWFGSGKEMDVDKVVPDAKIVDKKIQHPIEHHITAPTDRITKQLLRKKTTKRTIDKIDDSRDKTC